MLKVKLFWFTLHDYFTFLISSRHWLHSKVTMMSLIFVERPDNKNDFRFFPCFAVLSLPPGTFGHPWGPGFLGKRLTYASSDRNCVLGGWQGTTSNNREGVNLWEGLGWPRDAGSAGGADLVRFEARFWALEGEPSWLVALSGVVTMGLRL